MVLAMSHAHHSVQIGLAHGHLVHLLPAWAVALVYAAYLAIVITAVVAMARATTRMSRPGRIFAWLIAAWAIAAAIAVFVDAYRPTGDWKGGALEASFVVVYGLVASGIVWVVDTGVRRFRAPSTA